GVEGHGENISIAVARTDEDYPLAVGRERGSVFHRVVVGEQSRLSAVLQVQGVKIGIPSALRAENNPPSVWGKHRVVIERRVIGQPPRLASLTVEKIYVPICRT